MKNFIYLFAYLIICTSCSEQSYYGYVYDLNKNIPLQNVKVCDYENNKITYTDETGYFKLLYKKKTPSKLLFVCERYTIDTIPAYGCSHYGETSNECFKGQRIYLNRK
ncbi:hypothetical protein [Flavobacterium hungaricum]|uniref:hypothetical protein n=1 Tax=Flavobacterium hungaricum TaxID=2082725 RepID=UPI0018839267|nr:hypothetical protein [Flavobacterium hungaricum]